jgi:WD40 repeat protein
MLATIDLQAKDQSIVANFLTFNSQGDSLLISDSRNQVTLLNFTQNRFHVVADHLPELPRAIAFTGRPMNDQILTILAQLKKMRITSLTGDVLESIEANLHHSLEIRQVESHFDSSCLLTLSADVCNIWSSGSGKTIFKLATLKAPAGSLFVQAKFSETGNMVATVCKDNSVHFWSLENKTCKQQQELRLPS